MSILNIEHGTAGYEQKQVLFDVSFSVEQGDCVLLVGSNGSGKSTLFKAIYRILNLRDKKGNINFNNEDLTKFKTHELIEKGIMYIPQKDELFEDLTVLENLELSILYLNDKKKIKNRILAVLKDLPVLHTKMKQYVHSLSGGERKSVSLGLALLNKPKVLLFDEPLAGLSGKIAERHIAHLNKIKESGTTLVIIEHRIKELLPMTNRVIGLRMGRIKNQELQNLYDINEFLI